MFAVNDLRITLPHIDPAPLIVKPSARSSRVVNGRPPCASVAIRRPRPPSGWSRPRVLRSRRSPAFRWPRSGRVPWRLSDGGRARPWTDSPGSSSACSGSPWPTWWSAADSWRCCPGTVSKPTIEKGGTNRLKSIIKRYKTRVWLCGWLDNCGLYNTTFIEYILLYYHYTCIIHSST